MLSACSLRQPLISNDQARAKITVLALRSADLKPLYFKLAFEAAKSVIESELNLELSTTYGELPASIKSLPVNAHGFLTLRREIKSVATENYDLIFIGVGPSFTIPLGYCGFAEGIASFYQQKNSVAYARLGAHTAYGAKVILHEIGHLLGAEHTLFGVMAFESSLVHLASGYSSSSLNQMRKMLVYRKPFASPSLTADYQRKDPSISALH